MTYPVIVLIFSLLLGTGVILFIVPIFEKMFKQFGGKLPHADPGHGDALAQHVVGAAARTFVPIGGLRLTAGRGATTSRSA